jgi:hypothetical protein
MAACDGTGHMAQHGAFSDADAQAVPFIAISTLSGCAARVK